MNKMEEIRKRKLLMILYRFPPSNDAGAYRPIRFIADLNDLGWQTKVIAPSNGIYVSYDYESEKQLDGKCEIFRVPMLYPLAFLNKSMRLRKISDIIWRAWNRLAIPDGAVCWFPTAVFSALRIIKKEKIEVVFASGGPFSVLIIAGILSWISSGKIKVAIDYRDPWTLNPFITRYGLRSKLEKKLEKFVLHHMDAAIFNTDEMRELQFEGFKNDLNPEKVFTITNSFTEAENKPLLKKYGDEFTVIHAGNFYGNRGPEKFLEGLSIAVSKNTDLANRVKVAFYGLLNSEKLFKLAQQFKIEHLIRFKPRIPRYEIIPILEEANLLLLINSYGPGHHVFIPAKYFDYLRAKRPILCLAEKGALYNAVTKTKTGKVVSPTNVEEIAVGILGLYKDHSGVIDNFDPDEAEILKYRNTYTSNQLSKVFNFVCKD